MTKTLKTLATAVAMLGTLIAIPVEAKESEAVRRAMVTNGLVMYGVTCTTPMSDIAKAVMAKMLKEEVPAAVQDEADEKLAALMNKTGVGPWCRAMTATLRQIEKRYVE